MKAKEKKTSEGSEIAERRKDERIKQQAILTALKGKKIDKLTKKEVDDLLQAICLSIGITDKNGIIQ